MIYFVKNIVFIPICYVNAIQENISSKTIRLWLHNAVYYTIQYFINDGSRKLYNNQKSQIYQMVLVALRCTGQDDISIQFRLELRILVVDLNLIVRRDPDQEIRTRFRNQRKQNIDVNYMFLRKKVILQYSVFVKYHNKNQYFSNVRTD